VLDVINKPGFFEKLIVAILALIVIFGVLAIAVSVAFNKSVLDIVITVYGALGLNGALGAAQKISNKGVDQQAALNQTAQIAKSTNMSIPLAPALTNGNHCKFGHHLHKVHSLYRIS
jgi:hypothetical protein